MSTISSSTDAWLRRVHALLSKAESTEFAAEAEALLAKAQQLMTRHAIDDAMLREPRPSSSSAAACEVVLVEAPYASAKASLLGIIAEANSCRLVINGGVRGGQRCTLVGHAVDRMSSLTMFAALSLHAVRAMLAASIVPPDSPRRFRHAFLLAFAARIGERLRDASALARDEARSEHGASVSLVLLNRTAAVDRLVADEFPNLRRVTQQATSRAGIASGRAAADLASLERQLSGGPSNRLTGGG